MKKYSKFLSLFIVTITITITISMLISNKISINTIECFSGFHWNQLTDNTLNRSKKNNIRILSEPKPLESSIERLTNFPDSNTFSGVENNWNQNIINRKEFVNRKECDNNNNRVIVPPKQFLSFNIISPRCCEYTEDYTSSTGCVCLTPQQRQLLRFRYGNRS
tara:strand:- start:993 stop:1481 length:489 start_codon:yes stop_codon:yes gene_type:complete